MPPVCCLYKLQPEETVNVVIQDCLMYTGLCICMWKAGFLKTNRLDPAWCTSRLC